MTNKYKEVIDWVLVLVFLIWGIWFLREGHYFSTLLLWIGAVILLPYLSTHLRKQWDFQFYEQFKWPILVVLLSLLILNSQMKIEEEEIKVIVIEREIFAPEFPPEVQKPSVAEEDDEKAYVQIISGGYEPEEIAVAAGTTVVWNNTWSVHVLHLYQLDGKYKNVAQSKKLAEGELFSHTFQEPGIYLYRDLYFGWKGKVHVS